MPSDLDLRALRFLTVVVEAGSFGKAALRLHISQPALSVQIGRLEKELGTSLLVRSHRGVEPTPAGEVMLRDGARLLAGAAALQRRVHELGKGGRATLRVGFLANAAAELTPLLVRAFEARAGGVKLDLHEFHFADPLLGLADGSSDAALLRLPTDGAGELETLELFAERRVAVLPINHALAQRESVHVADLLEEPWVTGSQGSFRDFWTLQAYRDSPAPVVIEGGTVAEWWSAVASGRAICVSPASAERYDKRPELAFVPIADAAPSVCALAWHPGEVGPELAALIDAAREVRGKLPG